MTPTAAERGETVTDVITDALRHYVEDQPQSAGQQLDAIMRDMDEATNAWVDAGYGLGTPEDEAREAVFVRLREWNEKHAR